MNATAAPLRPDDIQAQLRNLLGRDGVLPGSGAYLTDATEHRGLKGRADAVALPTTTEQVAAVLAWCYEHDVAVIPRGGGTGYAGGAVPMRGGVVLGLERMTRVRAFDPLLWRICVEAGLTTADLRRLAQESGLFFPPDPAAAEQSQIGGNIATNAGGPHAFKYGSTGAWVTGLEAVVPPGEVISVGGPIRKDVAGYDLRSLLVGSEGTLAVITAAWLKLLPAPESTLPVAAFYDRTRTGCRAIEHVLGSGLNVAALEYLDRGALTAAGGAYPGDLPADAGFMVISEADGSPAEAARLQRELVEVLGEGASAVHAPTERSEIGALWHWRDGVSIAVTTQRGGKVSEDIVVPLDRLAEAIEETVVIGHRHDLAACSWGHAGDGNLHSTFLIAPTEPEELERARRAAGELFGLAARLGGSISGEHGMGWVKRGELARQWAPAAVELHGQIKRLFDPKNLLNPGKKTA
ncbi:MAG TPA: FAD-linked oxidase C-terminal domain-containing protein [Solirubrobacteraceae bacterium]|nr:FAD-linked oxidase C-terminal domain-containing protein [Solirubrobacteraceae bacterium]